MGGRVHFATEQLAGALNCQSGHFSAQLAAGAGRVDGDGVAGSGHHTVRFCGGGALGLVDQRVRATVSLVDDLGRLHTRFLDDLRGLSLGVVEVLLATIGGGEAVGDLLLPFLDGAHDVRPTERHDEPGHREERETLDDQRNADIHA